MRALPGLFVVTVLMGCAHSGEVILTPADGLLRDYPRLPPGGRAAPAERAAAPEVVAEPPPQPTAAAPAADEARHQVSSDTLASIEAALASEGADVGAPAQPEAPKSAEAPPPAVREVMQDGTLSVRAKTSQRCLVTIDAQRLGRAPLRATVPAGEYRLALSCKGGRRSVRDIEVRSGEQTAFVLEGQKLKPDGKARLVRRAKKARGATL